MNNYNQIGFTSSDLFCKPTLVMLSSFFKNNKEKYIFNFIYSDTSSKTINKFKNLIEKNGSVFKEWKINDNIFKDFIYLKRFGYTTYFRILLPFLVSSECKKILWIDSDTIVNKSMKELFEIDLNYSLYGVDMKEKQCIEKLGLSYNDPYINCGVLLYNSEKINQNYKLNDALKFFVSNKEKFTYVDQCFLNLFYRTDIGTLDNKYNDVIYRVKKVNKEVLKQKKNEDVILHYVGNIKPWNFFYDSLMYKIYWQYAKKIYGQFYFYTWYILSKILYIFKPFIKIIKKTRKVNI